MLASPLRRDTVVPSLDDAVATARLAGLDLPDLHERTARRWTEKKQTGGKPAEKE